MASEADTPIPRPATKLDKIKGFLGDLARPSVLWFGGASASSATIITALHHPTIEGAAVVAAAWSGVGGVYWAKAHEQAKVETAKAARPQHRIERE